MKRIIIIVVLAIAVAAIANALVSAIGAVHHEGRTGTVSSSGRAP